MSGKPRLQMTTRPHQTGTRGQRKPYLLGAAIWSDPLAEQIFARINEIRRLCYGMPPLVREKTSTEDIIRERLREGDRLARSFRVWRDQ